MMAQEPLFAAILNGSGRPAPGICTAAFSGGADSTALLLCLYHLRETLQIDLRAVHVHHGIRGEEADRDAAFCAEFCAKYGIPLQTVCVDVPAYAAAQKLSTETAARRLRYEALENAAPQGEIATAHHAGDNAETVLFHLLRGSGMQGLCGIPPRAGRIIRPLLNTEKTEILAFLRRQNQDFVEDSTNSSADCSRNRLRQEILPLLCRENPQAVQHIGRTAALLSEDAEYLSARAEEAYQACYDPLRGGFAGLEAYPRPIRMRVYMLALERLLPLHIDPAFLQLRAVDAALMQKNGTANLSGRVYAQVHRGILYLQMQQPALRAQPMQIGENRILAGKICEVSLLEGDALSRNLHTADTKATLDSDKIIGIPEFRPRSPQDRITLPGRQFSSLLKKCIQAEVPVPERGLLHTLYDNQGCIWCERIGVAARVKPDANSRRILVLRIRAAETISKE